MFIPIFYLVWRFVVSVLGKTYTALSDAMRPLPSPLLLCGSYCIAEADTTSDMTASTTMAAPTCTLPWTSLAPYMSATTWAPGVCEHNPNRAEGSEQWVQSVSSSTFEPAICIDNSFLKDLSINWHAFGAGAHAVAAAAAAAGMCRRDAGAAT